MEANRGPKQSWAEQKAAGSDDSHPTSSGTPYGSAPTHACSDDNRFGATPAPVPAESHQHQQHQRGPLRGCHRCGDRPAHGPRLRCGLGCRCSRRPLGRCAGGPVCCPVRRYSLPDLRAHRADDGGDDRRHREFDRCRSGKRPGHGLHRGDAGRRVPDRLRLPEAGALCHPDALHGDLGLHERHRAHFDHPAAWSFPRPGHPQGRRDGHPQLLTRAASERPPAGSGVGCHHPGHPLVHPGGDQENRPTPADCPDRRHGALSHPAQRWRWWRGNSPHWRNRLWLPPTAHALFRAGAGEQNADRCRRAGHARLH